MTTNPVTFEGGTLVLNAAISTAGAIRVELQDEHGTPISGYAFELNDADVYAFRFVRCPPDPSSVCAPRRYNFQNPNGHGR